MDFSRRFRAHVLLGPCEGTIDPAYEGSYVPVSRGARSSVGRATDF